MRFHVLTLFPEMVEEGLGTSVLGRAVSRGQIGLRAVNIRDYTQDKHKKVDDYPYGGGAGMLMQAQPVYDAYRAVEKELEAAETGKKTGKRPRVVYVTPQGRVFDQAMAQEFAAEEELLFLCGHYEGVDERVLEEIVTDYVSIGDYVLTGGELAAMVMIDAISRLVPGVLQNEESAEFESFYNGLLEYPQYTRPEEWQGRRVPPVLLSGNHDLVERWRLEQSEERTKERRPELYERYDRPRQAAAYLKEAGLSHVDMAEPLRLGHAKVLWAGSEGVLLLEENSGAYMLSAVDADMGERLLSLVPRGLEKSLFVAHQPFLSESVRRRYQVSLVSECVQAVYTRKTPVEPAVPEGVVIRRLDGSSLDEVYEHYHVIHDKEYLSERIESGMMAGAFVDGELAGFIGVHSEGSMGMLEVLKPYRRRGIGEALERHLINRLLADKKVPFCQVFTDNEMSVKLQEKIGLRITREKVYWLS